MNVTLANSFKYFPASKLNGSNFFYVWSTNGRGSNYFGLSTFTGDMTANWQLTSLPQFPVSTAFQVDKKIDDGIPGSGNVIAAYVGYSSVVGYAAAWWDGFYSSPQSAMWSSNPNLTTSSVSGSSSTCFDNAGVGGNPQQYSVTQNNGAGANCALSFRFQ